MQNRFSLVAFFLVGAVICSFAQRKLVVGSTPTREPIFESKSDSIAFAQLEILIHQWFQNRTTSPEKQGYIDSLFGIRNELSRRVVGSRLQYSPRYVTWDKLDRSERKGVKKLTLYNWKSEYLPTEIGECINLESLEIINSRIGTVSGQINFLPNLRTIEFYNNKPVHKLKFKKNTFLTTLIIRSLGPDQLPGNYKKLKALERLDLSRTKLATLPRVAQNKKLKELILTDNAIERIQFRWLRKHRTLEHLDIRANKIKEVPVTIGKMPALKTLYLNGNRISRVSSRISRLKQLEDLSFYSNALNSVPSGIYELKALRKLDLAYNHIEHLDSVAIHWKYLNMLGLDENMITSLPRNLGELRGLSELYLNNNRLTSLPEGLEKLTRLKALHVKSNYLTEFPPPILKMTNLENLDISGNRIASIPGELFEFKKFQILSLYGNPWSVEMKEHLPAWVEKLRAEKVFVLIEPPPESDN